MSSEVYSLLKKTREDKGISLASVASKTGISESTLHVIETGEIELLNIPIHTIEAYITRYGDFLELDELPSFHISKGRNYPSLTFFDYVVRLGIIAVSALLIYHVLLIVKENILSSHQVATVDKIDTLPTNSQSIEINTANSPEKIQQTNNNSPDTNQTSIDSYTDNAQNKETTSKIESLNTDQLNNTQNNNTKDINDNEDFDKAMQTAIENANLSN